MKIIFRKYLFALFFFTSITPVHADNTMAFTCDYQLIASQEGLKKPSQGFVLRFVVDTNKNSAYMLGNIGSVEVTMISTQGGITFVEVTEVGNVMTTTVANNGDSVHSRNSIVLGDLVPSQYYGKCVIQ